MMTKVLVVYSTRHGATKGIAEQITRTLVEAGVDGRIRSVPNIDTLEGFDAFVIGSAVYLGHWQREARDLIRRNTSVLAGKPVWLFSSGPLGTDSADSESRDLRAEVPDIAEIRRHLDVRAHATFFGAFDPGLPPKGVLEKLTRMMPASRELLPRGDFRDWSEIEAWARSIARELTAVPVPA